MKSLLIISALTLALLGVSAPASAALDTVEATIVASSGPVSVSVSTYAFTNVTPSAARRADMSGVIISNPETNSAYMHGHIGSCSSTSVAVAIKGPIQIAPGASGFISADDGVCIWLISSNASPESVVVQAVVQKR